MLSNFRNFTKSKIGAAIALAVLVIIAFAFVSGDLMGLRDSSGLGGGSAVATVDGENIDASELSTAAKNRLEQVKAQNPNATMKMLVAQGGVEAILDDLISRAGLAVFGSDHGVVASDRLIDSEISRIPAFQGVDGKFSEDAYRQALAQRGISEKALRQDFEQGLIAQQLMVPAQYKASMPMFAAQKYAALLNESRNGQVVALPTVAFLPQREPTDTELSTFYKANTNSFVRPERRVIRFATFGDEALKNVATPTDAEIAKRYNDDAALYAARNDRKFTQVIVPTDAAARAIVAEVNGGKSLEAAASEKGLSAASVDFLSREQIAEQFSAGVSQAVFTAPVGKLASPQKSALGWHVIRVEQDRKTEQRPLASVREEIRAKLTEEKRQSAWTDLLAKLEDQFENGASLVEVAANVGAKVETTQPLTADGKVYMKPDEAAPPQLAAALANAFTMDQEKPQLAQVTQGPATAGGQTYIVYDVTEITPSAPAPLNEIVADVKARWKLEQGSNAAKAAAIKIRDAIRSGKSIKEAVTLAGKALPPVQEVTMSRPMLSAALRAGRQVPPPVSLLFHMAKGTVKVQSAGQDRGWFVVALQQIEPGKADMEMLVKGTQDELSSQLGSTYTAALTSAIRNELGVTKHDKAIKAVRDQLGGTLAN